MTLMEIVSIRSLQDPLGLPRPPPQLLALRGLPVSLPLAAAKDMVKGDWHMDAVRGEEKKDKSTATSIAVFKPQSGNLHPILIPNLRARMNRL